mgnify:CR=1 FL=1
MCSLFETGPVFEKIPGDSGGCEGIRVTRKYIGLTPIYWGRNLFHPLYMGANSQNFRATRGFLYRMSRPEWDKYAIYGLISKKYGIITVDVADRK